ncbi:hypothetical protein [Thalassotalea ganghwensis]
MTSKQPSNNPDCKINTDKLTQALRPPKKPMEKYLGKHFRKVELAYEDILGFQSYVSAFDGRYATLIMSGSAQDTWYSAFGINALLFFAAILVPQLVSFSAGNGFLAFKGWGVLLQLFLLISAMVLFIKSKKKQALAVVCDRKTGNVNFPAFAGNPELVIPFSEVEMYRGSIAYSRGSGMPAEIIVPKMYPKTAKYDFQYDVLCADSYDELCKFWTVLTEFMDKNKPIPYGAMASIQSYLDKDKAAIWEGTKIREPLPLDPEIKDNYRYVYFKNEDGTVEYPPEEITHVIAPYSDNPELLQQNIERAYQLKLLIFY